MAGEEASLGASVSAMRIAHHPEAASITPGDLSMR
jgi:hypothetical protein